MIKGFLLGIFVALVLIASAVMYACLRVSSLQLDDEERL